MYFKILQGIAFGGSRYRIPWFGATFKTKERWLTWTLLPISQIDIDTVLKLGKKRKIKVHTLADWMTQSKKKLVWRSNFSVWRRWNGMEHPFSLDKISHWKIMLQLTVAGGESIQIHWMLLKFWEPDTSESLAKWHPGLPQSFSFCTNFMRNWGQVLTRLLGPALLLVMPQEFYKISQHLGKWWKMLISQAFDQG